MRYQRDFNGYPTFSAMPDSLELVPTFSDVGQQPEIAMAANKPEVVIYQEGDDISVNFRQSPHIAGRARHI